MKSKTILVALSASFFLYACSQNNEHNKVAIEQSTPVMTKLTGLKTPESVVQAKDGKIYVSEINEFGKDGDGQISVIENGQASVLVSGLDDPKGLAIIGDNLYVADKQRVYQVRLGEHSSMDIFVDATAFPKTPQFLNDLEADPQGNLYVSDSGDILGTGKGGIIYQINPQGQVTQLIDGNDDERVLAPNGLLADDTGNHIIYVDFTSGVLYNLNAKTGTIEDIADGFGGGDGVVHHSSGTMYISDWKSGKVFSLSTKGEVAVIKDGYQAAADIAITKDERYLMVPDMKAGELDFIALPQ